MKTVDDLTIAYQKLEKENEQLKQQLSIAVEALKEYSSVDAWDCRNDTDGYDVFLNSFSGWEIAKEALGKIGVK